MIGLAATVLCGAGVQQALRGKADDGKPCVEWVGAHSKILEKGFQRVRTQEDWDALWHRHTGVNAQFAHSKDAYPPRIDFSRFEVIAFFRGPATNTDGEEVVSIGEVGDALRIRFDSITYQTMSVSGPDHGEKCEPFGIWVIDRTSKPIVIEENVQGLLNQPPKWKEQRRFEALPR
jgi:hypothetical protein